MIKARQALTDVQRQDGTYGSLAARLFWPSVDDIPKNVLHQLTHACCLQLAGAGRKTNLMRAISRLLVRHWCEEDNHSGYRLMVLEAPDLEHARPGGVPFSKTSIVLWTRQLAKLVESRAEIDDKRIKQKMLRCITDVLEEFRTPDLALIFDHFKERETLTSCVFTVESLPSVDNLEDRVNANKPLSLVEYPVQDRSLIARMRAVDLPHAFRVGLTRSISSLVISMQMRSGWLGVFCLGTRFSRLAAISSDVIAIEFGKSIPVNWNEDGWELHVEQQTGRPDLGTTLPEDALAPITLDDLFSSSGDYHLRLCHDFDMALDDTCARDSSQQCLLDSIVAAAIDRIYLPWAAVDMAIDMAAVNDGVLHQRLLSLLRKEGSKQTKDTRKVRIGDGSQRYHVRQSAIEATGISLIRVSAAQMDELIDEHIEAVLNIRKPSTTTHVRAEDADTAETSACHSEPVAKRARVELP